MKETKYKAFKTEEDKQFSVGFLLKSLTFILISVVVVFAAFYYYSFIPNPLTAVFIARRIDVEASWSGVRGYLFESLQPGMTREEVYEVYNSIGKWEIHYEGMTKRRFENSEEIVSAYNEEIWFTERSRFMALFRWNLYFDEDGILLEASPRYS